MNRNIGLLILMLIFGIPVSAQIGEHRNDFAIGFNGGYMISSRRIHTRGTAEAAWRNDGAVSR